MLAQQPFPPLEVILWLVLALAASGWGLVVWSWGVISMSGADLGVSHYCCVLACEWPPGSPHLGPWRQKGTGTEWVLDTSCPPMDWCISRGHPVPEAWLPSLHGLSRAMGHSPPGAMGMLGVVGGTSLQEWASELALGTGKGKGDQDGKIGPNRVQNITTSGVRHWGFRFWTSCFYHDLGMVASNG